MKLSAIKKHLETATAVDFQLPDGTFVPEHFHVTEIGLINRHFIDCGGVVRNESTVNFQLLDANDYEHRLKPQKLLNIIKLSEKKIGIGDLEAEVEYQNGTIGKFGLEVAGDHFILTNKHTACLAQDQCGIPSGASEKISAEPALQSACCTPGGGCC